MIGVRPVSAVIVLNQACTQVTSCDGDNPPVSSRSNTGARSPLVCITPAVATKYRACAAAEVGELSGLA